MNYRYRIYQIIEPAKNNDKLSRIFNLSIIILIILNISAVIISSFELMNQKYSRFLDLFELISIIIFTMEYLLRLFTAKYVKPELNVYSDGIHMTVA